MGSSPKCFYVMWPYRSVLFAKLISCPTCSVCRVLNAEEEGQDSTVFLLRDPAFTSLLRRSRWPATARGPPCKAAHVLCSPSDAAGPDTCAFRCVADATRLASPWLAALHVPRIQALDRARVAFLGTWPLAWPVQEVGVCAHGSPWPPSGSCENPQQQPVLFSGHGRISFPRTERIACADFNCFTPSSKRPNPRNLLQFSVSF